MNRQEGDLVHIVRDGVVDRTEIYEIEDPPSDPMGRVWLVHPMAHVTLMGKLKFADVNDENCPEGLKERLREQKNRRD